MDEAEQRRRRFEQSTYSRAYAPVPPGHSGNVLNVSNTSGQMGGDRQPQMLNTRPSSSATVPSGAGGSSDLSNFNYPQAQQYGTQQVPSGSLQYQNVFSPDSQRPQGFPQYAPQLVYSVPQQMPAGQPQYEQYQSRQAAAPTEVLGNQFGSQQYFPPGSSNTTGSQAATPQYSTAQFQPTISFNSTADLARSTLASPYPTTESVGPQGPGQEQGGSERQQEPDQFDFFYSQYGKALRETNENTSRGRLVEAGESLLQLTGGLLGNVEKLGEQRKQKLSKNKI